MNNRLQLSAVVLLAASVLGGCASSPAIDATFGQSVRGSVAAQVYNPAAAANTSPVLGLDAHAALGAQQQYQKSFTEPPARAAAMVTNGGR